MASANDQTLENIRLLSVLPPEVRRQLETMCQWRRFARGEQIFGHQDSSTDVGLIVRGRVRVLIYSSAGRQISFEDLGEGSHFGEVAAIDGGPRSASVVARTRVTLAVLSGQLFMDLCGRHPELGLVVMRGLTDIVRRITSRVVALSTLGAQNRVHAELLHLAREHVNGASTIIPLPHHADIAARVSTTRETVARVLADLVRRRVVERQGDTLLVRDLSRLSAMVEDVRTV
ncbi:MAG: Crp/Fnr family transcriptional regulator [Pseudomonadota bacterium]